MKPNPDFWVSALHKQLVGPRVLAIQGHKNTGSPFRVFAHCGAANDGTVVVFGINVSNRPAKIRLEEPFSKAKFVDVYGLSAPKGYIKYDFN